MAVDSQVFSQLKQSNKERLEVIRHLLSLLDLDITPPPPAQLTPCFLLTENQVRQRTEINKIWDMNNGMGICIYALSIFPFVCYFIRWLCDLAKVPPVSSLRTLEKNLFMILKNVTLKINLDYLVVNIFWLNSFLYHSFSADPPDIPFKISFWKSKEWSY